MNLLCPFDKRPCLTERCMAWHKKEDLATLQQDDPEGYNAMVVAMMALEHAGRNTAIAIMEHRNEDERCKLIRPDPVI